MSVPPGPPGPLPGDEPPADDTREMPRPEPRFAGQPYTQPYGEHHTQPYGQPPPSAYAPPGPYAGGVAGNYGPSWHTPDAGLLQPGYTGWPSAPPPDAPRRTGLWIVVTLLVAALVGGGAAAALLTSGTSKNTAGGGLPPALPSAPPPSLAPAPAPTPSPSDTPLPMPSLSLVPTPPGLLAIGYHAYALSTLAPADVAIDAKEVVQFSRDGLQQIVGLRALTLGSPDRINDDYDASINILRFRDAAGAQAELTYSNTQNKKTAPTVPLPGLPNATGFLNKDDNGTGISVGAFTTVGPYQVVVIVGGLSPNRPTNAQAVIAEAARVMRAVLPDVADIKPPTGGGGGTPQLPTPTPTGTRA